MFGLGMGELLVILVVALLVLGPKRLPDMATGLGKAIRDFKRATSDIQNQLEVDEAVAKPLADLRSALNEPIMLPTVRPAPRPAPIPAPVEGTVAVGAAAALVAPAPVLTEPLVVTAAVVEVPAATATAPDAAPKA